MKIICNGNRGSHTIGASGNRAFEQFGGDTTSLLMICDDNTVIALDAGSGAYKIDGVLKTLGFSEAVEMHMFFSHFHSDHTVGLAQLTPLFSPGNKMHLYAPKKGLVYSEETAKEKREGLRKVFRNKANIDNPELEKFYKASISFNTLKDKGLDENQIKLSDVVTVSWIRVQHGEQYAFGYKIENSGKVFSIISDFHHDLDPETGEPIVDPELISFIEGSDVLMSDSYHTDKEFAPEDSFGHSTGEQGVRMAHEAGIPIFMPHHYKPKNTDGVLRAQMRALAAYADDLGGVTVVPAKPDLVVDLNLPPKERLKSLQAQESFEERKKALTGQPLPPSA
jgi:ribonuclease BN (tRNA processing enzyme)